MDLEELLEESIPLIAEDLRVERRKLGITTARAARKTGFGTPRYRAFEQGRVRRTRHNAAELVSAARRLGLASVRASLVEEIGEYMRIDLSADGPLTVFVEALEARMAELKEEGYFVSARGALTLLEEMGFDSTFESRSTVDKEIVELWIGAVFTLCLGGGNEYYVRLVRDDPPDVEVLEVDGDGGRVSMIRVEVAQHGKWSHSLRDVIGKKLRKRYEEGTALVVLVEHTETLSVVELDEFIRANNPHNQRIFVIGGGEAAGRFKIVPWAEVSSPAPGETAWAEMNVDAKAASEGYRGYAGAVFKPPGKRFPYAHPVFVKKMKLRR